MSFYVRKYSGERELFDVKKFSRSLKRSGADQALIDQLILEISAMPAVVHSTREIYDFALSRLHKKSPAVAAHYNIKRAILDFGPSGFPFEQYIAELFRAQGYSVKTNVVARGFCINHELDAIATRNNRHLMIECKFHNQQGLTSDIKVPLYSKARFDDVARAWKNDSGDEHEFHEAVIVTNTRFTADAIVYAECAQVKLLGWSYPADASLEILIDRYKLHPITTLVSLNNRQKKILIDQGLVLCRDVNKHHAAVQGLGLSEQDKEHLIQEMHAVCRLK